MEPQNNTEEIWKPVVGYESVYEVSDLGRVRRCSTGRILKPWIQNCVGRSYRKDLEACRWSTKAS